MPTQRKAISFAFQGCQGRRVVASFNGGAITSNAGALLLSRIGRSTRLFERVAACFTDHRDPRFTEHALATLVAQRIVGLALGHEDLNDHDQLRHDPVLGLISGKIEGARSDCAALAGKSTLNRLGHAPEGEPGRYHRIGHDVEALQDLLPVLFTECWSGAPPSRLVLDIDCTDIEVHGRQQGRFFTATTTTTASCPCTSSAATTPWPPSRAPATPTPPRASPSGLGASSRSSAAAGPASRSSSAPTPPTPARSSWPSASGRTSTTPSASPGTNGSPRESNRNSPPRPAPSGATARRVVAKAEHLPGKSNPRFVVTSLPERTASSRTVYERIYCPRGEAENAIKEQQLDLFAARTSATPTRANQLRLLFSAFASVLTARVRDALDHTRLARATAGSLRLKLLKIGARVSVSVRRVAIAMDSHHPFQTEFARVHASFPT